MVHHFIVHSMPWSEHGLFEVDRGGQSFSNQAALVLCNDAFFEFCHKCW